MRVMTFNLRFANPIDGANQWDYRKELVVETIFACEPDLVGTQEGTVPQLDYLTEYLGGFLPLVAHRQGDPTCQYPTIFYRRRAILGYRRNLMVTHLFSRLGNTYSPYTRHLLARP